MAFREANTVMIARWKKITDGTSYCGFHVDFSFQQEQETYYYLEHIYLTCMTWRTWALIFALCEATIAIAACFE